MGESRSKRDPVVVLAGGCLLAACVGWAIWGSQLFLEGQQYSAAAARAGGPDESGGILQLVAIVTDGTAAVLAAYAICALRGSPGAAVAAAWVVGLLSVFVVSPGHALINVPIVALLAWAGARMRRAGAEQRVRRAVREPAVLVAGVGGLAASAAVLGVGAAERGLLNGNNVSLDLQKVPSPLFDHVTGTAPAAIALVAAAVGTLRGWHGWSTAAVVLSVVVGGAATLAAPDTAPVSVSLTAVLLVATTIARTRLRRLADEQDTSD